MPRLSDRPTNALLGVIALISLYRKEPKFEHQFRQICQTYRPDILNFVMKWIASHRKAVVVSEDEYCTLMSTLKQTIKGTKDLGPDSCIGDLDLLAWKWKLKLVKPLAGFMLFLEAVTQEVKPLGIKVQEGPAFHPYSKVAPLTLKLYDWQIMEQGQNVIIKQVRTAVTKYTAELRASAISEYPSSLKKHAEW
jgi:hypothetical protein